MRARYGKPYLLFILALLYFRTTREFTIGAGGSMLIDIAVENAGENAAFEAVFLANLPDGLQFVKVEGKQQVGRLVKLF